MAGEDWKNDGKWSPKYLIGWISWIVISLVVFFALELNALFDDNDSTPTLTEVITRWVPGWLLFSVGGGLVAWGIWHFIASYNEHKILGQDEDGSTDNENEE